MTRTLLPLLAVPFLAGAAGIADATVLCAHPGGPVFARDQCVRHEQPVDLGATSNAYTYSRRSVPLTPNPTTVAQVNVAPGSYVIQAYVFVENPVAYWAPVICTLASGGAFDFGAMGLQPNTGAPNISSGTLALNSVADMPQGGVISMTCYNNVGSTPGGAFINIVRLTATRVASLTHQ